MELPKYNRASRIGAKGITILKDIVETELGWKFRVNHQEDDFGIDGYLDVIANEDQLTGKTIAVQVKTGASYFEETNVSGWVYRGDMAHLNYYLNHDIPVVLVLVDEDQMKGFWALCDASRTERAGASWKITIPFNQVLDTSAKAKLMEYVSPVRDYASQLDEYWNMNKFFTEFKRLFFLVDRADVESGQYEQLQIGIERLMVNPDLVSHVEGKVDIFINDYESDERELDQIPEFRTWVGNMVAGINGWAYFLVKDEHAQFFKLLQLCYLPYKRIEGGAFVKDGWAMQKVEVDYTQSKPFFDMVFHDLNQFTEKHGLSLEINRRVTGDIFEFIYGIRPEGL